MYIDITGYLIASSHFAISMHKGKPSSLTRNGLELCHLKKERKKERTGEEVGLKDLLLCWSEWPLEGLGD